MDTADDNQFHRMASFERTRTTSTSSLDGMQKFPIRRLEPAIQKFLKVLEIDLSRLTQHKHNIEKFCGIENWAALHKEQINASRTVQQVKANVREVEKTRNQILDEDIPQFDAKIQEVKLQAVQAVIDFMDLYQGPKLDHGQRVSRNHLHTDDSEDRLDLSPEMQLASSSDFSRSYSHNDTSRNYHQSKFTEASNHDVSSRYLPGDSPDSQEDWNNIPSPQLQLDLQHDKIPESTEAHHSWENLKESLMELNSLVHEFAEAVQSQQEKIDHIEDNLEMTHENINQGVQNLGMSSKLKAAIFPVAGALIGGAIGGPVGFLAGIKIGGLAAVGGGVIALGGGTIVGFASGHMLKKKQSTVSETEMQNLSSPQEQESLVKNTDHNS